MEKTPPTHAPPGWSALTVDRPVATIMVVLAVVVFGWVSLQQLPVNLMPELNHPTITVRTDYPGAAPEEVEEEITIPLEELVGTVEGVTAVRSTSRAGASDLVMQFQWDTNLDDASQKVRERIGMINFPAAAGRPLILRYDPTLDPILRMAVHGEAPLRSLRAWAEDDFKRQLERIPGVAMVRVTGGEDEVIRVRVDERRLQAFGLRITAVEERLRNENVNVAGGQLLEGDVEYLVRTLNEFRTLDEIRQLVITSRDGIPIRLGDFAEVDRTVRDRKILTRMDGSESIEVALFKEADANIVAVAEAVKVAVWGDAAAADGTKGRSGRGEGSGADGAEGSGDGAVRGEKAGASAGDAGKSGAAEAGGPLGGRGAAKPAIARTMPDGMEVELLSDQSAYIRAAIAEVTDTALQGGIWAVLVLLLFLRSGFATAIIGLAIPLSVLATFAPLRMLDVSLNTMSLGGLALGIGMLVDNAIVVLESIHRCREEGDDVRSAAIRGVTEVGAAVVASTMTTVAVFLPVVFIDGIAGQLFGDLALTVVLSLAASLVFALWFVPMLYALPSRAGMDGQAAPAAPDLRAMLRFTSFAQAGDDVAAWRRVWREGGAILRAGMVVVAPLWWTWWLVRTVAMFVLELAFARILAGVLVLLAVLLTKVWRLFAWVWSQTIGRLLGGFAWIFDRVSGAYRGVLGGALRGRIVTIAAAAGVFWVSAQAADEIGMQLIPELHQGELVVRARLPVGTRIEETARVIARVETAALGDPLVRSVASRIGSDDEATDASERGEHFAEVTIRLREAPDLAVSEREVIDRLSVSMAMEPGLSWEFARPTLFTLESPIAIEIRGWDLAQLGEAAGRVMDVARTVPGLENLRSSAQLGYPEVRVVFDRERLAALGLNVREVAETVRSKVQGVTATEMREGDRKVDLDVSLRERDVQTLADLEALEIGIAQTSDPRLTPSLADLAAGGGAMGVGAGLGAMGGRTAAAIAERAPASGAGVRLGTVATIRIEPGPAEIRRLDGQRAAVVSADSALLDLSRTTATLRASLAAMPLDPGLSVTLGGQAEEMDGARRGMIFAMLLAVFLVYVVMASTFESVLAPLVILFSIPLALSGVVGILLWTNTPLSVVALIGVIVLVGIVVNNAIVLIDYVRQLTDRGMPRREAILLACTVRLRPIAITTLTTVLGMLPMALGIGEGAELRRPLAWVIVAGLSSSTLLTLLVIPAVYDAVESVVDRVRGRAPVAGAEPRPEETPPAS